MREFFRWLFRAHDCYFCLHGFSWSEWKKKQRISRHGCVHVAHEPGACPRPTP